MNRRSTACAVCALFLGLVGCGGSGGAEEPTSGDETAGGDTTEYEGPIASTDVARGQELFSKFCDDCHPDGDEDVGPSLIATPRSPARIRQQVREGSGKMRPFPENRVSADDLEALLAYLASINAVQ